MSDKSYDGYAVLFDPKQLRGACFLCGASWTGLNEHTCTTPPNTATPDDITTTNLCTRLLSYEVQRIMNKAILENLVVAKITWISPQDKSIPDDHQDNEEDDHHTTSS